MATAVGPVKFRRKNYAELKYSIIVSEILSLILPDGQPRPLGRLFM